jgi:hypothetical protein
VLSPRSVPQISGHYPSSSRITGCYIMFEYIDICGFISYAGEFHHSIISAAGWITNSRNKIVFAFLGLREGHL